MQKIIIKTVKKNLFVTGLVFCAVFCGNIAVQAQLPQQSTESSLVWYYIQVMGSGATADLDNPVISTDDDIVWMYAKNVKTGKYLTDAVASPQGKASFLLEPLKTDGNEIQQWKWIAKSDNNRRTLVNRATGNMVSTDTDFDLYYYLLYTSNPTDGDGWQIERIADNQFAVYSTDAKGIVKYWHATLSGKATESYTKDSAKNSAYAWVFVWAPKGPTGITQPILPDNIRVYASDKRIYVEGCDNYTIFTLQGIPVYRNANLPAGIYLVTMEGKTSKVLVQ